MYFHRWESLCDLGGYASLLLTEEEGVSFLVLWGKNTSVQEAGTGPGKAEPLPEGRALPADPRLDLDSHV